MQESYVQGRRPDLSARAAPTWPCDQRPLGYSRPVFNVSGWSLTGSVKHSIGPDSVAWGLTDTPVPRAGRSILAVGGADAVDGNGTRAIGNLRCPQICAGRFAAPGRCEGIGFCPGFPTSGLVDPCRATQRLVMCLTATIPGSDLDSWRRPPDLDGLVAPTPVVLAQADAINAAEDDYSNSSSTKWRRGGFVLRGRPV